MDKYLVAIPTSDPFLIASSLNCMKGLRVLTIENGVVNREDQIQAGNYDLSDILNSISSDQADSTLKRCLVVNSDLIKNELRVPGNFLIYRVSNPNITNAINSFIRTVSPAESDYLCQP